MNVGWFNPLMQIIGIGKHVRHILSKTVTIYNFNDDPQMEHPETSVMSEMHITHALHPSE